MQTFLPYADFARSASVLDSSRLGNQRNEGLIVLKTLLGAYPKTKTGRPGGWPYHPATRMWRGYECALALYINEVCALIKDDTVAPQVQQILEWYGPEDNGMPPWLGDRKFHRSHRAALVRKLPGHYRRHFPFVRSSHPYLWPHLDGKGGYVLKEKKG